MSQMERIESNPYGILESRRQFIAAVELRMMRGLNPRGEGDIFEGAKIVQTPEGGCKLEDTGRIYPRFLAQSDSKGNYRFELFNESDLAGFDSSEFTVVQNP